MVVFCFFFKQKTAYEMRISDWSSDVCSSDLRGGKAAHTDGLGSHQIQRIAKPEDTAAFGEQIVERRRQEFLLDRGNRERIGSRRHRRKRLEIGRASCRESGCQYV